MKSLEVLLIGENAGDEGLAQLTGLTELRHLEFGGTKVTDKGLQLLASWPKLEKLRLWGNVNDAAMVHVRGLRQLKELDIYGCRISDMGLSYLAELEHLEVLRVTGPDISDAGLANLVATEKPEAAQSIRCDQHHRSRTAAFARAAEAGNTERERLASDRGRNRRAER
jgi:hypothetical protein